MGNYSILRYLLRERKKEGGIVRVTEKRNRDSPEAYRPAFSLISAKQHTLLYHLLEQRKQREKEQLRKKENIKILLK